MACSVSHTYDEIKAMVEKQIEEDKARQLAIINLVVEYDNAYGAKNDMRKAYEECNHILQENEEALREILEEKAMGEKAWEEKIRQKQADDEEFFLEFRVMTSIVAILHSINRVLSKDHNDWSLAMLTVDFSTAFNLRDRSELLDEVKQGDTHKIKDTCKLLLHAWYLDDGTVIGDSDERLSSGVKLLGGTVSRDANFISGLDMRRATNVVDLMSLLSQLLMRFDLVVRVCTQQNWFPLMLFSTEGPILDATRQHLTFTNKDTVPSKAQQTLSNVLFSEMGLGQHTSPVEYRTILKYHLMILLFSVDAICPVCRKACLDSFGEHAVHCKELSGFKYRHDMVRNVLFDIYFEEYTLRDYYCWLKTYCCCWYKLKLMDNAADSRLRLLEESAAADNKMKK
nr:auxilin-like protein [Tanacetum cinerariifolium]